MHLYLHCKANFNHSSKSSMKPFNMLNALLDFVKFGSWWFATDRLLSLWSPFRFAILAHQYFFECLSKYFIENCIKDWIDHWTGVAKPCHHIKYPMADLLFTVTTNRWQQVQHEKRRPQYDKCKENHTKDFGCFLFETYDSTMTWWISRHNAGISWMMRSNRSTSIE